MIDLHVHTTASDGSLSLDALVKAAKKAGLKAIAVTDHDNIRSARLAAKTGGIEVIPGVELTVYDYPLHYLDIHVLGIFIDPENKALNSKLAKLEKEREAQKKATVKKLRELGYKITFAEVKKKARGVVGRPHIAMALAERYPKEFPSVSVVFEKLLARGRPAYLERKAGFGLGEAIALIHAAGGIAILAHPFVYPYRPEKLAADFRRLGGDALETHYDYIANRPERKTTRKENDALLARGISLAGELGLLQSGGSDFHGVNKGQALGGFGAPDALLERLRPARRKPL
ncbi:MAG: PHP domain-containing protein [Candidatus ainarchaeum sp.]|nr:PHP domain-containing protein [Candidatus ainarchaeum sp.]